MATWTVLWLNIMCIAWLAWFVFCCLDWSEAWWRQRTLLLRGLAVAWKCLAPQAPHWHPVCFWGFYCSTSIFPLPSLGAPQVAVHAHQLCGKKNSHNKIELTGNSHRIRIWRNRMKYKQSVIQAHCFKNYNWHQYIRVMCGVCAGC